MPLRAAGPIAALVLAAGLPAAASAAPVLAPLKPCYDAVLAKDPETGDPVTEPITIAGSGFTPGALVDVIVDGRTAASGVLIDDAGVLAPGTADAPYVAKGRRAFDVTVVEQGNPMQSVTASTLVTRLAVRVRPRRATPSARVTFSGSGFTADAPVYAHYLRRGKLRRTVRLVKRPTGPCGDFTVRRRQFPFTPVVGRWTLQVDQHRRYRRVPDTAFLRVPVDVTAR